MTRTPFSPVLGVVVTTPSPATSTRATALVPPSRQVVVRVPGRSRPAFR